MSADAIKVKYSLQNCIDTIYLKNNLLNYLIEKGFENYFTTKFTSVLNKPLALVIDVEMTFKNPLIVMILMISGVWTGY